MRRRTRQRAVESTKGGGGTKFNNLPEGIDFYRPSAGISRLDIIPYVVSVDNHPEGIDKGDIWQVRTILVHYGVGPEEKTYLCRKTIGKRCPICEYAAKLRKTGEADEETLKSLKPSKRDLYNVIDTEDRDKGIQLWEHSYFLFGARLEEELNESDEEYDGYALPDEGYTLKVRFKEKQLGKSKFYETTRIDFIDRKKQYDDDIVEQATDLDAILNVLSYEELEQIFLGVDDDDDLPTASNTSSSSTTKSEDKPASDSKDKKSKNKATSDSEDVGSEDSDNKCPAGGVFGESTDSLDDCDSCSIWEECIDLKENNE